MKTKDVHVAAKGDSWKVTQGGTKISTHRTQKSAIEAGRREARKDGVDLVTYGRDGRIRSKDSFAPFDPHEFSAFTWRAIQEREVLEPPSRPSVSRAKIAEATRNVFRTSGRWVVHSYSVQSRPKKSGASQNTKNTKSAKRVRTDSKRQSR